MNKGSTNTEMADQQTRVHPARDVESSSEQMRRRKAEIPGTMIPPSSSPKARRKNQNFLCRCFCWILVLLVTALVTLGISIAVIYLVFRPKLPQYDVDSLRVSNLRINLDLTLYAEFDVKITARNPNEKIGIYYEKGGHLGVWYAKTKLCEGPIPRFYQGKRNVTKLDVTLKGTAQYGNAIMSALKQQQETSGRVPLDLEVDAPVAVRLGKLKMRRVRILGKCKLVVDSLSENNRINIKASDCRFGLKL
ncbi:PREDICTED: protein YLS9 [Tarenaya hassleriana]|uniref:protein YLS9 n=1 Tax=Tarenaya hassleriana TaxID=28532 RepID=UPI00053C5434|nr:PREDICTED: protein YLS9 [Tarenaya hassleriana]